MKWVTRQHPRIDRIACHWLIKRLVDKDAESIFVPPDKAIETSRETGAIPYDIDGVELTHDGLLCSFDAILKKYNPADPALEEMATIIRGADNNRHDLVPQCPGVYAILIGLSHTFNDDHEQLKHGMVVCEALYAWCKHARQEKHGWNPQQRRNGNRPCRRHSGIDRNGDADKVWDPSPATLFEAPAQCSNDSFNSRSINRRWCC